MSLAFWRWTLAFLFTIPFTWPYIKRDWQAIRAGWKMLAILSFFGITCFNTMLYIGLQTTTAINGSLMQTAMPAVIVIFSLVLYREQISRWQAVGVTLALIGAVTIILRGDWRTLQAMAFVSGDVWILFAVVLYALYSALLRRRPAMHSLSFLSLTFLIGAILLLPAYVWEVGTGATIIWTIGAFLSLLYVGIFPSILAYLCWNQGVALIGPNKAGLFINLVPVFTAVLSILFLGEQIRPFHWVGMGLIVGGMILFNRLTNS